MAALLSAAVIPITGGAEARDESASVLTSIKEVRQLSLEAADSQIPVRLQGVITYYDATNQIAFLQDKTSGIFFKGMNPDPTSAPVSFGDQVELAGFTRAGNFSPFIDGIEKQPATLRRLTSAPLPKPLRPRFNSLLDPRLHGQWVEVIAFLTYTLTATNHQVLELNTGGLEFQGTIPVTDGSAALPASWLNRELRLRGVYSALYDEHGQMIGMKLFIQRSDQIEVAEGNSARIFAEEYVPINELMRFKDGNRERVRVKGTVVLQVPGSGIYLRGEHNGLFVETTTKEKLHPGQMVEAVGRPAPGKFRPVLREAIVRAEGLGSAPEPIDLLTEQPLTPDEDAELVRLKARLIGTFDADDDRVLLLQAGKLAFKARLLFQKQSATPPALIPGSMLELTGVCSLNAANDWTPVDPAKPNLRQRLPTSFTLLVAGPTDLKVLSLPSWWTAKRMAWLAAGVGVLALLALVWVALLRHEVRKQTNLLTASVQRESTREERTRIARDLHDTLQQNLAGIILQTNSAKKRLAVAPDLASDALDLAADMARHTLEEVRSTVWNLRNAQLDQVELGDAVGDLLHSFPQTEEPKIRITLPENDCRLPGVVLNHLLNFIREAMTNAVRHAAAKNIHVQITRTPESFEVIIADDGKGFDASKADVPNTNHFGLYGMRERALKLKAQHQITSLPGCGTTVKLTLPINGNSLPETPA